MSRLIVYRGFGSPPSRAVQMLGELIGIQPEIKEVNLLKAEHKTPEFRKLNPMCTVPVLQEGDFVLADSNAIMKYLLEKYGGDKREILYPSEVRARALVDQTMFFNVGIFFPAFLNVVRDAFYNKATGPSAAHIQLIDASYFALEAYLKDKRYVSANHLTLADLAAGSTATVMKVAHKVDPEKYPRCAEWLARLEEEHIFKTINAPGAAFMAKMTTTAWENNKENDKQYICVLFFKHLIHTCIKSRPFPIGVGRNLLLYTYYGPVMQLSLLLLKVFSYMLRG